MAAIAATRSISISLDERVLDDLDQELSQGKRSARQNRLGRLPRPLSYGCSSVI
jgi:hypothetical protein